MKVQDLISKLEDPKLFLEKFKSFRKHSWVQRAHKYVPVKLWKCTNLNRNTTDRRPIFRINFAMKPGVNTHSREDEFMVKRPHITWRNKKSYLTKSNMEWTSHVKWYIKKIVKQLLRNNIRISYESLQISDGTGYYKDG